jgi:hypothetical protein
MTRHSLAFFGAIAAAAIAAPATAQDGPPPPPAWGDPQAPHYLGPQAMPMPPYPQGAPGPDRAGAPFVPPPPVGYPGAPVPYPPAPIAPGATPHGAMGWGPPVAAYGYGYQYGGGPAPCGCAAYPAPPMMWVPVPIQTRYSYSPPIRHDREVVEETVTRERVVETVSTPVHRETKYVKSAAPAKYTKKKVVKTTK